MRCTASSCWFYSGVCGADSCSKPTAGRATIYATTSPAYTAICPFLLVFEDFCDLDIRITKLKNPKKPIFSLKNNVLHLFKSTTLSDKSTKLNVNRHQIRAATLLDISRSRQSLGTSDLALNHREC
jgi:hypothetical protein